MATRRLAVPWLATLVGGLMGLAAAGPVAASCAVWGTDEEMLAGAEVVIVGRVTALTNENRWATVAIDEIWRGPALPAVVDIRGGEPPGVGSSVDRHYAAGQRYLFAVAIRDGTLRDTACSMTQPWDEALLGRFRPADVRTAPFDTERVDEAAQAGPFEPGTLLVPVAIVLGAGIAVFGVVRLVRDRDAAP